MILAASKRLRKFFNSTLTDEMICQQIVHEGKLDNIHQLNILSPEAAHSLIQREKRMELLSLGITELSPAVAEELAQYKGEKLYLNCIKTLSLETAKAIARFKGVKLMLNGVTHISYQVLGRLASYQGSLHLDGVDDLDVQESEIRRVQTIFQNLECSKLSMAGLVHPSLPLIEALALCRGQLELNGIETLSTEAAEILCEHTGKGLSLKNIKVLSTALVKIFTRYTGFLDVSGAQVVENDFLYIAAARPEGFTLFSGPVKRRIESYKAIAAREKAELERETREQQQLESTRKHALEKQNAALFAEFDRFDERERKAVAEVAKNIEARTVDPYSSEIEESVVKDIELNLNQQIDAKKKQMSVLLKKGFANLSVQERQLLQELREQIEKLKADIRGTLDILVEKKELGAIVFTSSDDLAAYLKKSGEEDDESDALANIEDADLFGSSFEDHPVTIEDETVDEESAMAMIDMWGNPDGLEALQEEVVEGDDFIISEV